MLINCSSLWKWKNFLINKIFLAFANVLLTWFELFKMFFITCLLGFFLTEFCSYLICFVSPLIHIRWNVGAPGVPSRLQVADHKEHPPDVSGCPGVQHLPMAWAAEAPTPDVDLWCSHGGRLVCILFYLFLHIYYKRWLLQI